MAVAVAVAVVMLGGQWLLPLLLFLPVCRRAYISTLQKIADRYKDRPFGYLWAQGGSQPDLEADVGVGGYGEWQVAAVVMVQQAWVWRVTVSAKWLQ